jgi:hypothetical protein
VNTFVDRPSTIVEQARQTGPGTDRDEVDDDGHVVVAAAGVPLDMLIDPDRGHAVESGRIVDQHPLPLGEHGVVRGVLRHVQAFSDPGDGQRPDHDRLQRPPPPSAGQLCPAAAPPSKCPDATYPRSRSSGSAGPSPAAWSDAIPAARAPTPGSRCPSPSRGSRNGGTAGPARRPGKPAPRPWGRGVARQPRGRARRGGRTWLGQGK